MNCAATGEKTTPQVQLWREAAQQTWLPFLLSRFWVFAWVYAGHFYNQSLPPEKGIWPGIGNFWLNPWTYFDSRFFLGIATHGYEPPTTAFFPLYPALLRFFTPNETLMAFWGILISNAAFACALPVLYRLTSADFNPVVARRAIWVLAFFPTTAYFSAVYTESLFFLLLVTSFWFARQQKWGWSGAAAFFASLTRNAGSLIFISLLWFWYQSVHKKSKGVLVPIAFPLLGFLGVQIYFASQFGGALAGLSSQAAFTRKLGWPWIPLWKDARDIATQSGSGHDLATVLGVIFSVLSLFVAAWLWRRGLRHYSVLVAGIMLMHLTLGHTTSPYTSESGRFMMTTFPFVQTLAVWCEPLSANRMRLILSITICLLICGVMCFRFGVKSFIG